MQSILWLKTVNKIQPKLTTFINGEAKQYKELTENIKADDIAK